MMYSKTLIILTLLLCIGLIYLVYDCKCDRENFQNSMPLPEVASNTSITSNLLETPETFDEGSEEGETVEDTEFDIELPAVTTPAVTTPAVTTPAVTTPTGVIPLNIDTKYAVNTSNLSVKTFPEMNSVKFYEFSNPDSKIDISNVNSNKLTFSAIIKPRLPLNTDKKEEENRKKIIASGNNWYIELKSNNCKFVYNGVSVESKVNINFEKFYLVSVVVAKTYISILINGNEVKKEYNVPDLKTSSIKVGLSGKNMNPFYGFIGNIDLVSGNLTDTEICARHNYCSGETPTCSFKAAGKTRMDCIRLCDNDDNCSSVDCQNICLGCKNPLNCEWLSLDENSDLKESSVPDAPEIRALAHGDGQLVLDWQAPSDNGSSIKNYAIIVNESFNKNNGITFRQLADTNCSACEYVINGLKNRVYYDVSVAAVNDIGMGEFSNVESVAPMGPMRNSDISPLLVEDDAEIESQARKQMSDELNDQICSGVLSQQRDGHFLNKKRVRFADQVKDELVPKLFK